VKVLPKKKKINFFILAKKSLTKKLQGYQVFGFSRFLLYTLFDYSASFYRKTSAWCVGKVFLFIKTTLICKKIFMV
jgi:hypothetical protein